MTDKAHRLTDEKLEEMAKRLYDIVEVHVPEPAKMTLNQASRELDAKHEGSEAYVLRNRRKQTPRQI